MTASLFACPASPPPILRPYQQDVIDRVRRQMAIGHRRIILQAGTGSGKSNCSSEIIRRAVEKNKTCLFIAHRRRLIEQKSARLKQFGVPHAVLDRAATLEREPALAQVGDQLAGSVLYPDDEYGDAHAFTCALAALGAARGIAWRYGEAVEGIETEGGRFAALRTDRGRVEADALLLATAAWTPALARPLGLRIWINPVKGYSASVPLEGWNGAPRMGIMDDGLKIAIAPFAGVLRLAGTAEFAGWSPEMNERRARNVLRTATSVLPDLAGQAERKGATFWTGLRPVSPDGSPFVGATRVPGVFVNAGHGPLGWTFACGSGKLAADIVDGAAPDIDPAPYSPARFN
jgi:D-amino-acid dehydrogenase